MNFKNEKDYPTYLIFSIVLAIISSMFSCYLSNYFVMKFFRKMTYDANASILFIFFILEATLLFLGFYFIMNRVFETNKKKDKRTFNWFLSEFEDEIVYFLGLAGYFVTKYLLLTKALFHDDKENMYFILFCVIVLLLTYGILSIIGGFMFFSLIRCIFPKSYSTNDKVEAENQCENNKSTSKTVISPTLNVKLHLEFEIPELQEHINHFNEIASLILKHWNLFDFEKQHQFSANEEKIRQSIILYSSLSTDEHKNDAKKVIEEILSCSISLMNEEISKMNNQIVSEINKIYTLIHH